MIFPPTTDEYLALHARICACRAAEDFDALVSEIEALTPHTRDLMLTWHRCRIHHLPPARRGPA